MENNNTPAITPEEKAKTISAAWSKMGLAISATDLRLQAMSQKALAKIKIPTTIAEILPAEKSLTELRADYTEVLNERKKVTDKLNGAITHLMVSEKTLADSVKPLADAILALKKQAETEALKVTWHDNEIKRIREHIAIHLSNYDAKCKQTILTIVDKAYSYALGNGNVQESEVSKHISSVLNNKKGGVKQGRESEFALPKFEMGLKYATQQELTEIWEHAIADVRAPFEYVGDLQKALEEKFEFYNIAIKNKAASLAAAAEDKEKAEAEIQKAASEAEGAAKIEAMSTTHVATPVATHKDIKKVHEIEMLDDDWTTIQMVASAFIVNLDKCKPLIRAKIKWNVSFEQMAVALCKLKDSDPAFGFGTMKFKIVEKL